MALTAKGISRQDAHEEIRVLSQQAAHNVKVDGLENDLLERIRNTDFFKPIVGQLEQLLDPKTFVGRAPEQVAEFIQGDFALLDKDRQAETTKGEEAALTNGEVQLALNKYLAVTSTTKIASVHC